MQKQGRTICLKSLCCKICNILRCKKNKPKIAVIALKGVIANNMLGKDNINFDNIKEKIDKAFKIKNLKAIALSINSPGGAPVQTEMIYQKIKNLSKENSIPIFSFIEDIAASGGYWLALSGEEIYASRSSIIGSIGVISAGFGFKEMINKLGIERRVYMEGKNKSLFDPFQEEKPENIRILKEIQHDIYEHFTDIVKKERNNKLSAEEELFDGTCWSGVKAKKLGLIDDIGNLYDVMKEKFGSDIIFEEVESNKSWIKKKLGVTISDFSKEIIDNIFLKLQHKSLFGKLDQY